MESAPAPPRIEYVIVPKLHTSFWARAVTIMFLFAFFVIALLYASLWDVKYAPNYRMFWDMVFDNYETSVRDLATFVHTVVRDVVGGESKGMTTQELDAAVAKAAKRMMSDAADAAAAAAASSGESKAATTTNSGESKASTDASGNTTDASGNTTDAFTTMRAAAGDAFSRFFARAYVEGHTIRASARF
jgi:uncharacterized protein YbjQ (UPF0145 family)